VVLTIIVLTVWLIRTFGDASIGRFNPQDVGMVLGYTMTSNLHSLFTLSLYIALVSTLSRMYADSEMVIWQSSGKSVLSLIWPTMRFSWLWLIAITALSLMAWPWSNQQIREMRERYEKRGDIDRIKPGQFQESADGKRVFFIDNSSINDQNANRIFVISQDKNTQTVVTAQTGKIETRDRDRFFVLQNGQRLEFQSEKNELKLIEFTTYASKIDTLPVQLSAFDAQSLQPLALLNHPTPVNLAELGWRIGMAIAAFNLTILALAIPFINPRSGRSGSLILTILSFFTYYNLVNMSKSWVSSGLISMPKMLIFLHLPIFLLAFGLLYWRQQQGLIFSRSNRPNSVRMATA
jgi:lipopolysaccharide export system permease protein